MKFLRFLEGLRTPFFDTVFALITHVGEEMAFLVIAIAVFWCVNKRKGYYILVTGFVGTVVNQTLKLACKVPRPWKEPGFTAVESAIPEATGYSFPSGHTQNVAGTFGALALWSKRISVRILLVAIILLVSFSRMYLGVHTPYDVGFSLAFAAVLVIGLYPLFADEANFKKFMPYVVPSSCALALANLIYAFCASKDGEDVENLLSARENAVTLFTCALCLVIVYFIDIKLINFKTDAAWYAQIIKLVLGLAILLAIKEGLKPVLYGIIPNPYVARGVNYFTTVMFAGCVWPLTFGFFSRLRIASLDNLFKKNKTK